MYEPVNTMFIAIRKRSRPRSHVSSCMEIRCLLTGTKLALKYRGKEIAGQSLNCRHRFDGGSSKVY